jgi:hypothetical protein
MAKPISMFQGPAPQAMAMMGQGLSEAGANIGRFYQQGLSDLGKGIASGIQGAASQYKDLSSAKAANNVTKSILGDEGMYKTFFPQGTEDQRKSMLDSFNKSIESDGQMGGMQYSSQVMGPLIEQMRLGQQFQQKLQLQGMQEGAAMSRLQESLNQQRESEMLKYMNPSKPTYQGMPSSYNIAPSPGFGNYINMTLGR